MTTGRINQVAHRPRRAAQAAPPPPTTRPWRTGVDTTRRTSVVRAECDRSIREIRHWHGRLKARPCQAQPVSRIRESSGVPPKARSGRAEAKGNGNVRASIRERLQRRPGLPQVARAGRNSLVSHEHNFPKGNCPVKWQRQPRRGP